MNEATLAFQNGLSRKTMSVTRDKHRDQVIVVEQVTKGLETPIARTETYYRIYTVADDTDLNVMIQDAKDYATRQFLGLEGDTALVPQETTKSQSRIDAPTKQETEKAAKKATTKKAPKKAAAKKAPAKAAEKVEAATPEPAAKEDEPFGEDDLGAMADDEPAKTPVQEILYDKGNREHASHLKPLLSDVLGAEWKTEGNNMDQVRALITKLNGKVGVTDVEGEPLDSFIAFCKAQLK